MSRLTIFHRQVGPNPDKLQPDFGTVAGQVRLGGGGMLPSADRLAEEEINAVAAYVPETGQAR